MASRRIDRQRRERILEGVVAVIAEHGLEGLSFRRVAAAAQVPLGATTYYFTSREEMFVAAITRVVEQDVAQLREQLDAIPPDADLAQALSEIVLRLMHRDHRDAVVALELSAAALRREHLRATARAWDETVRAALEPRIGRLAAINFVAVAGWLSQRAQLGQPTAPDEVVELLREVLRD